MRKVVTRILKNETKDDAQIVKDEKLVLQVMIIMKQRGRNCPMYQKMDDEN